VDAGGRLLGLVSRFNLAGGDKTFRPLIFARRRRGGTPEWAWESWPSPRPLYGLQALARRPDAPVIVVEGEKAADAASKLLPGFVAVTSPNGSTSAGKADWAPLRGRRVVIWPDADVAGLARLARNAGAAEVSILSPAPDVTAGFDAADALRDAWDEAKVLALIATARQFQSPRTRGATRSAAASTSAGDDAGPRRRPPQRDLLIGLADCCELLARRQSAGYISLPVKTHRENWPIRSRECQMWLAQRFFEETGGAIGGTTLDDALRILEAMAVNTGPEHKPFTRVGSADGRLYLDLCDAQWRCVEIDVDGYRMIDGPPVKFLRSAGLRPLTEPEPGYDVDELRGFLNVGGDHDFVLVVAWLVAAYRDRGPYPVLVVNGEQGTGKSVFSRMVRALVDPSIAPIRAMPKDDRDLLLSATSSHVLAFDNLSSLPTWFSDAACRLSTGGGFATRRLHTDRDEVILDAQRPVLLNGIPMLTERPDLAQRAVTIHLRVIAEEERRPEEELWVEFEQARPRILGALLDGVSVALRNMASVRLERAPRLADFAKWVVAAQPGLGWHPDLFLSAYGENRREVAESTFEADPLAVAIVDLVTDQHRDGWVGTATELLAALNGRVPEGIRKSRIWPAHAQSLGNRFEWISPLLRNKGFKVDRRHTGVRTITIMPP
jgi:hypothetical protein